MDEETVELRQWNIFWSSTQDLLVVALALIALIVVLYATNIWSNERKRVSVLHAQAVCLEALQKPLTVEPPD